MRTTILLFSFVFISSLSFSQGYMHSGKDNMSVALFDSGGVRLDVSEFNFDNCNATHEIYKCEFTFKNNNSFSVILKGYSFYSYNAPYELGADARARMDIMVRTNDGFEISEEDLRLRGPGDITGTQQSGVLDLKISDLARDGQILKQARIIATEILAEDRELKLEKNKLLAEQLRLIDRDKGNWSRIS